jgi:hypothetical protein
MFAFLNRADVRLLDFKQYAVETSAKVKQAALAETRRQERPVQYLSSSQVSKEELAQRIMAESNVGCGVVCALTVVEPCMSFEYHRSQEHSERGLRLVPRKCLHVYVYMVHPEFGFMNARIQTWFPFNVQICMNGREWLARQLARRHSKFERADNCFTHLGNPELAQRLLNEQLSTCWPGALTEIARQLNPLHTDIFARSPMDYYWSAYQTEWATDVLFRDPNELARIYPLFVRHATEHFKSPDVMRFLGRKLSANFQGELTTSFKKRTEGVRVKHWVRGNSIKIYDKADRMLRVETTIGRTNDFKVLRSANDDPKAKLEWKPLRKGVADLHRRAEISQRSNERYLDALAVVEDTTPCSDLFNSVARPVFEQNRRFRALRIGHHDDLALFEAISRGEFATAGFRNREIRALLFPKSHDAPADQQRRLASKVSRQLRLLRAHGLIRKIPKTHRYLLTDRGRLLTAALAAVRAANIKKLLAEAA